MNMSLVPKYSAGSSVKMSQLSAPSVHDKEGVEPNLASLPIDVLLLIEDHLRAASAIASDPDNVPDQCYCQSHSYPRTKTQNAYESSDPSLALTQTCRDIQIALEERSQELRIPYCWLGAAQSSECSGLNRENVQSLTIHAGPKHLLRLGTPSLQELVGRFPNIKTLCVEWSYGWNGWHPLKGPLGSSLQLRQLEEVRLDLRQSECVGDGSIVLPELLALLGLSNVPKLVIYLRRRDGKLHIDRFCAHEARRDLRASLELLQVVETEIVIEIPIGNPDIAKSYRIDPFGVIKAITRHEALEEIRFQVLLDFDVHAVLETSIFCHVRRCLVESASKVVQGLEPRFRILKSLFTNNTKCTRVTTRLDACVNRHSLSRTTLVEYSRAHGDAVLRQSNDSASEVSTRAIIEGERQVKEEGVKSFFASLVEQLDKEKMVIEALNNPSLAKYNAWARVSPSRLVLYPKGHVS